MNFFDFLNIERFPKWNWWLFPWRFDFNFRLNNNFIKKKPKNHKIIIFSPDKSEKKITFVQDAIWFGLNFDHHFKRTAIKFHHRNIINYCLCNVCMCSLLTVIIFIQYNTTQTIPVPSFLHFDAMKREKLIRLISLSLMVECVSYTNTYACVFVCDARGLGR